jgi:predicted amidohydrolase
VEWQEVKVLHLPGYVLPRRLVRVAVIDSRPGHAGAVEDNARHYASEIDKACAGLAGPDIIVLPENFNRSEVKDNPVISLDSEYLRILGEAARRNRVYLTGSIRATHDGAVFNTAILLDRQGRLAGSYNKTHLTVGEMAFTDLARGTGFRLFDTDFGKIAVLICWDFHFPEASRLMALKGAELVLVPMASDARLKEDGVHRGAEHAGKAFVLENRIPVVFSATLGSSTQPSLIIDQHGVVLARTADDRHIIQATLDLAAKEYQWSGDDFQSVYTVGRRPELYQEIGLR